MSLDGPLQLGLCENGLVRRDHILGGVAAVELLGTGLLDDKGVDALNMGGGGDEA